MLKRISIQNFKAFGEPIFHLPLGKLTIFLGPNGSGKTSIFDALGLLSQTAGEQRFGNGFTWRGRWIDFGPDGRAAINRGNLDKVFVLGVVIEPGLDALDWYSEETRQLLQPPKEIYYGASARLRANEWKHVCMIDGQEAINEFIPGPTHQPTLRIKVPEIHPATIFSPHAYSDRVLDGQLFAAGNAISIANTHEQQQQPIQIDLEEVRKASLRFSSAIRYLREWLSHKVFLIGPDRMPRMEEQNLQKYDLSVGRNGEQTINLLSYIFATAEYAEVGSKIQNWANVFRLGGLKAGFARKKELLASFTDPETKTALGLQYAGYGSQQVLPIVTQIFAAPRGSVILIEEPEISLHPEAQLDLVGLFADGVNFGQQIIITTHSTTLPLALSEAERSGMTPEDIVVYHFGRISSDASVQRLDLDQNWSVKGWVPSFSKIEQKLLKKWMEKVDLGSAPES